MATVTKVIFTVLCALLILQNGALSQSRSRSRSSRRGSSYTSKYNRFIALFDNRYGILTILHKN